VSVEPVETTPEPTTSMEPVETTASTPRQRHRVSTRGLGCAARMTGMPRTVITFGTFDVFHVGHLRVIERAAALGDRLVVGVSADALNLRKKGREPVFTQGERLEIVAALRMVDEVFVEESLELKRAYLERYDADVLVMGDDWRGKFDEFGDICEVVYLPRTPAISTTALIEKISATG
jgi:choline-phosphate cytidylyltransferase